MPSSVRDRLTPSHEVVYFLTRSTRYRFHLDAIRQPMRTRQHQSTRDPARTYPPAQVSPAPRLDQCNGPFLGGFAVVDEAGKMWAGKIAEACGWPHEVRRFTPSRDGHAACQAPARDRRSNVSASVRPGTDPPATASFASTARVHTDAAQNASVSSGVQALVLARM